MTDRYAELRAALERVEKFDHPDVISAWLYQASTVRALLADYDRMRKVLQREADWHDGKAKAHKASAKYSTGGYDGPIAEWHTERAQQIRAALAQEQGESDAQGH